MVDLIVEMTFDKSVRHIWAYALRSTLWPRGCRSLRNTLVRLLYKILLNKSNWFRHTPYVVLRGNIGVKGNPINKAILHRVAFFSELRCRPICTRTAYVAWVSESGTVLLQYT